MKPEIHPENYRLVAFKDMSNEDVFITKSTAPSKETIKVDGAEYPLIKLEVSRTSHPYYTGKTNLVEVMEIIASSEGVISNDSGLMHVSASLDKKIIVLYGSSSPTYTPPLISKEKRDIIYKDLDCKEVFVYNKENLLNGPFLATSTTKLK